jgi:hypothetical protein
MAFRENLRATPPAPVAQTRTVVCCNGIENLDESCCEIKHASSGNQHESAALIGGTTQGAICPSARDRKQPGDVLGPTCSFSTSKAARI